MSQKAPLRIKADRFLLPVVFPVSGQIDAVLATLHEKVGMAGDFLRQASLVLDLSEWQGYDESKIAILLEALHRQGLRILGLRNARMDLTLLAQRHGLAIFPPESTPDMAAPVPAAPAASPPPSTGLVIDHPVRAGQQIYARGRDLVVLHGVNVGGEVLADGNIHVYGRLAGRALAGALGDTGARIMTSQMEAQLLSIAGHFMLQDHPAMEEHRGRNVGVSLHNEELHFDTLG